MCRWYTWRKTGQKKGGGKGQEGRCTLRHPLRLWASWCCAQKITWAKVTSRPESIGHIACIARKEEEKSSLLLVMLAADWWIIWDVKHISPREWCSVQCLHAACWYRGSLSPECRCLCKNHFPWLFVEITSSFLAVHQCEWFNPNYDVKGRMFLVKCVAYETWASLSFLVFWHLCLVFSWTWVPKGFWTRLFPSNYLILLYEKLRLRKI